MMLSVQNLHKSYGITPVLNDITFSIKAGEKIALIGPNGCGKTTLLRILHGLEQADAGSIHYTPSNLTRGYLPQGFIPTPEVSMADFLDRITGDGADISARLEELAVRLIQKPVDHSLQTEYDLLLTQLEESTANVDSLHSVLATLGLVNLPPEMPLSSLSGGQKTRLGLAGLLVSNPRLLLLDEPTNHLDFEMLEWLEDWLIHSRSAVLVVSHDRTFLDHVVSTILEMDPVTHQLKAYAGTYSDYLGQKEAELNRHWQQYKDQQDQILELTRAARHVRGLATFHKNGKTDSPDKFARGFFSDRGLATVKKAKNIEARVERLLNEERIEKPRESWQMKMDFAGIPESGRDVLILQDLSVGYGDNVILHDLNAILRFKERAALIGPNGCGKTTLLRTAAGMLEPLTGKCRLGSGVVAGYMSQEQTEVNHGIHALTTFQKLTTFNETDSRAYLHKFLFDGDEVFTPAEKLSYGQRARLSLACLVAKGCNFLLLDEPLNHLDLSSRTQFEQALREFEGTILMVVHDRYFIQRYATCIWQIADGKLTLS